MLQTGAKGIFSPGHINAEVFGNFVHRPMPHSLVVRSPGEGRREKAEARRLATKARSEEAGDEGW